MYNNHITYDKKWETELNIAAFKKLQSKYFSRSFCYPSCPLAWAPEVLELLETLDKEFGLRYNDSTIMAYHVKLDPIGNLLIGPIRNGFSEFYSCFVEKVDPDSEWSIAKRNKSKTERLIRVWNSANNTIKYELKGYIIKFINPILNKVLRPKVSLDQIKEKYGTLRLYYSGPEYAEEFINKLILKTEIKLSLKGAYLPIEVLWGSKRSWTCGTEHHPDIYITKKTKNGISVEKTIYREAMKDLGIILSDIEEKFNKKV
jgi:hypothetical protein